MRTKRASMKVELFVQIWGQHQLPIAQAYPSQRMIGNYRQRPPPKPKPSIIFKPRNRREAVQSLLSIGGMAAGGLMLSACGAPSVPQNSARRVPVDFSDPMQSLRAFIKLIGDLDPTKETPGWFGGTVFADTRRDRPLRPLLGVEGFGVVRTEAQPDGSFRVFNRECAFYKGRGNKIYRDRLRG